VQKQRHESAAYKQELRQSTREKSHLQRLTYQKRSQGSACFLLFSNALRYTLPSLVLASRKTSTIKTTFTQNIITYRMASSYIVGRCLLCTSKWCFFFVSLKQLVYKGNNDLVLFVQPSSIHLLSSWLMNCCLQSHWSHAPWLDVLPSLHLRSMCSTSTSWTIWVTATLNWCQIGSSNGSLPSSTSCTHPRKYLIYNYCS
jgi:hypothetical protein